MTRPGSLPSSVARLALLAWLGGSSCLAGPRLAAAAASPGELAEVESARLLGALNRARQAEGRPALEPVASLAQVAERRAEEMAKAGSLEPEVRGVLAVSRRLKLAGYEAHRWAEHAVQTAGDLLETWRELRPREYREAVEGDYTEAGIGFSRGAGTPVYVLIIALPKRLHLERETAPLRDFEAVRGEILASVNAVRREAGRRALSPDSRLDRTAQRHAEDMLRRRFYSHQNPEGEGPMARVRASGYEARWAGENIARGLFSPAEVMERWLESTGHRRNILGREFAEIGIGVAVGGSAEGFEVLWVQVFAAGGPAGEE